MISGQTPLTTIGIAKDLRLTYQPLILVELAMVDGSFRRFSPENNDITEGGHQFQGHDWLPRIMEETLGALQSVSDQGIIQWPQVSLKLSDGDKALWLQDETDAGPGYKGAIMRMLLVFWDADTSTFSSDYMVKFVGRCNAPQGDENSLTLSAVNILNLANFNLPTVRIGRTCPWVFPVNHDQRVDAALNEDSDYFFCHYSQDVTDADGAGGTAAARGNVDPSTGQPFTDCGLTWDDCIARMGNAGNSTTSNSESTFVQIEKDIAGRRTGSFGGIRYDPPDSWRGREYTSGSSTEGINNPNDAKYSDYFPMCYGTGFVDPPVMNVNGDPNLTRFEVVLGVGQTWPASMYNQAGPIRLVIVNDFIVPFRLQSSDPTILGWSWVNGGNVEGHVNRDTIYDGRGDPYGSLVAISITVPKKVQDASGIPTVRVLWDGMSTRSFKSTDPTDFDRLSHSNPVWHLLDILVWATLTIPDIDLNSFLGAAALCTTPVTYTDLTNTSTTHARYSLGLALRQRRSAAEVVNAVLQSFKAILSVNTGVDPDLSGKFQIFIKQTLADQQGAGPVDGSNDDTPYPSAYGDGTDAVGYVAYHFDDSNILRQGDRKSPSTFKIEQRPISDTPGQLGAQFQDENYSYTVDSLSVTDSDDVGRSGQLVSGSIAGEGFTNFDQVRRAIQSQFAEQFRGNPRSGINNLNDSGGTWIANFDSSFRAIHLKIGDIVAITKPDYGLDAQTFRVLAINPSSNCERITLRCQWHEDDWYLDSYGQNPDPRLQAQHKHRQMRPPFGWNPNETAPLSTDHLIDPSEKTFALAQVYEAGADGTAIASLRVRGKLPVNDFSGTTAPPYAPLAESDTLDPDGTIPANHYYLSICGKDATGKLTGPSWPPAQVDTTGSTSSITLPNIFWHEGTVGYKLYAGPNPNKLTLQATGDDTPTDITLVGLKVSDEAIPDVEFDHLEVRVRKVAHSGIWGAQIVALDATTITIDADPGFDMTDRIITVIGRDKTSTDLPVWDFTVDSGMDEVLTIRYVTDLTGLTPAPKVGDVVVMRARNDVIGPTNQIGDNHFVNGVQYFFPPIQIQDASGTPILVTTSTAHGLQTGDKVFVTGVQGNPAANGIFPTVTIPATADAAYNNTHAFLDSSASSGDYSGGGTIQRVTAGMEAHAEKGNIVRIIRGTGAGQERKITDNNTTTLVVDSDWAVLPDETSKFIVFEPNPIAVVDTSPVVNSDPTVETTISIPVDNYIESTLLVQAYTESVDGKESVETDSPYREIFVFGGPGNIVTAYDKVTFNIAVSADLSVQDDVAPPLEARTAGTPFSCRAKVKIPSVDADINIDVHVIKADASYAGTIFTDGVQLVIPAGSTDWVEITDFHPLLKFVQHDEFIINVTQVGSTQAGANCTISLKWLLD